MRADVLDLFGTGAHQKKNELLIRGLTHGNMLREFPDEFDPQCAKQIDSIMLGDCSF